MPLANLVRRLPGKDLKGRLMRFNPELAKSVKLHNRGRRKHLTKLVYKWEARLLRGLNRQRAAVKRKARQARVR